MTQARIHFALTILWALLLVPTLLWWRQSILWVAFMSLYANFASHWACYEAAKAKEAAEATETEVEAE